MDHPVQPPPPADELLPAWRAAVLAYRAAMRRGEREEFAHYAAWDAYLAVRPEDGREEAGRRAVRAVAYAAARHTKWFWRGAR